MTYSKESILNIKLYLVLFLIAFIVVFSSTYNPINFRRMHVDSSVYVTIAQGITRGYLPYRDFVDNKGPLTYLFSAAGLRIGGFTGIWITEIFLMFITVFFAYKTALFFGDKFKALLGTVFSFILMFLSFNVNAGTEEYSLPFLMISFFIFTKFFFSLEKETAFYEPLILGICFAAAIMIRLNTFPLWAGFCITIFIECIKKRRFAQLVKYVSGFLIGIIIIILPLFLYLYSNRIINSFFEQVIVGGASRGFGNEGIKDIVKNYYNEFNRNFSFFPLFFGIFSFIIKFKQAQFTFYCSYTITYLLMLLFLFFSSGDNHYNMILIPFFIPAIIFLFDFIDSAFHKLKVRSVILILFACFIFSEGIVNYLYDFSKIIHDNSGAQLINAGKMIDTHTKTGDKIISLGFNGYIYPFTQRDPASKYFYQGSGLDHIPGSQDEFKSDILTAKPAIIVLFTAEDGDGSGSIMPDWHEPIIKMIESDYRLLYNENGFKLFKRLNNDI